MSRILRPYHCCIQVTSHLMGKPVQGPCKLRCLYLPLNFPLIIKKTSNCFVESKNRNHNYKLLLFFFFINHRRNTRSTQAGGNAALLAKQSHYFPELCWISWINVAPTGLADWRRMDPIYFPTIVVLWRRVHLLVISTPFSAESKESMEERILLTIAKVNFARPHESLWFSQKFAVGEIP